MFTWYYAILEVLKSHNINAEYGIGFSLGEYEALLHNDVFDIETELDILEKRGPIGYGKAVANVNGQIAVVREIKLAIEK